MIHIILAADEKLKFFFEKNYESVSKFYSNILVYDLGNLGIGKKLELSTSYTANQKFPKKPLVLLDALENVKEGDNLIWLDCDTLIVDRIDEVFNTEFNIGVTIRKRKSKKIQESWINSGVIFLKNNYETTQFVKDWLTASEQMNGDQFSINSLIKLKTPNPNDKIKVKNVNVQLFPCWIYNNFYFNDDQSEAKILHYKTDVRKFYPFKYQDV